MDLKLFINLLLSCVLNIIFFFSGVVLNTLVILTILKSTPFRKKLCHFMIMVLSCCDLLTVITNILGLILYLIAWLTENHDLYTTVIIYIDLNKLSAGLSMSTLMVMCIERYLGVYHPFSHKKSVTRHKLLTLLAILIILPATLIIVSTNDLVLSRPIALGIFMVAFVPLFIFFNYKLLKISRKMRRENTTPTEKRRVNLKNIHTCLLTKTTASRQFKKI